MVKTMRFLMFLICFCSVFAQENRSVQLTLKRAVEIATSPEGNARIQIAGEGVKQAESRSAQARAGLLPNFDATVSQQSQTRNLEAFGLRIETPIPGFSIPKFVGPYNVFDVRATGSQNLFDLSTIRRYQASKAGIGTAKAEQESASENVAAQVAKAYMAALRSQADVEAREANVTLAEALLKQAENLKNAGTGTGIEVTRARVQMLNEKQRLLDAQKDRRRAQLQLLRAMNLNLATQVELTGKLAYQPVDDEFLTKAEQLAQESRPELKAQLRREDTARLSASATRSERIPSLALFGDYGSMGTGVNNAIPTRAVGVALRIPIYDGGRRDARRAESSSQYRQEQVRTHDLKEQIGLDVRLAIDTLRSADEQVKVATEGLKLAENELAQARRRTDAGVASSLEVTDAQTRLARARDNYTAALFLHESARIDLGQATGLLDRFLD